MIVPSIEYSVPAMLHMDTYFTISVINISTHKFSLKAVAIEALLR